MAFGAGSPSRVTLADELGNLLGGGVQKAGTPPLVCLADADGLPTTPAALTPSKLLVSDSSLLRWSTALTNRTAGPVNVLGVGTSVTSGTGPTSRANTWLRRLETALQAKYGGASVGFTPVNAQPASTWTLSGGTMIGSSAGREFGITNRAYLMIAGAGSATITVYGDHFWVLYSTQPGGGTLKATVDGGSPFTVGTNSTDRAGRKLDIPTMTPGGSAITPGNHTLVISPSTGADTVTLDGVAAWFENSDLGRGIRVFESGCVGSFADDWAVPGTGNSQTLHYGALDTLLPDLVIIELGVNEHYLARSVTTFKSNIAAMIDNYRTLANPVPSIVLLGMWGSTLNTKASWLQYRTALRNVALEKGVAMVDIYSTVGYISDSAEGALLAPDGVHPSDRGAQLLADQVMTLL